jgi:hypothetical protein
VQLKVGDRWRSAGSAAEVIVVRAPDRPVSLTCGGIDMVAPGAAPPPDGPAITDGLIQIGKRYVSEAGDAELLCVKGGAGVLGLDGIALQLMERKKLPSSD